MEAISVIIIVVVILIVILLFMMIFIYVPISNLNSSIDELSREVNRQEVILFRSETRIKKIEEDITKLKTDSSSINSRLINLLCRLYPNDCQS